MKKLLFSAFIIASVQANAQECETSQDCLSKGIAAYYNAPAIEYMDKALKLAKKEGANPAEIYFQRGIKYYNHNDPHLKEAEQDFKNALAAEPKLFWAHIWLANLYAYKQQDMTKAVDFLTNLTGKFNSDPRIFYERAYVYRYFSKTSMAATDMEMAYNMLLDDASLVDDGRRVDIILGQAQFYMESKNSHVSDAQAVKIMEDGVRLVPNSSKLIGALALGYYDIDDMVKAGELGEKANELGPYNSGGQLFEVMRDQQAKNYKAAYDKSVRALEADIFGHPMVHYAFALAQWEYTTNVTPNAWNSYKDGIRENLQKCYNNGKGTKYDVYATWAYDNLSAVK